MNRRSILKGALSAAVSLSLAPMNRSFSATTPNTVRLNNKMSVITGVGSNVVTLTTNEGLLLVDSGAPEYRDALMNQLRGIGSIKVHTLFNTHWHLDSTGSNEVFGRAGAKIIAHERTKQWIATDHYNPKLERYEKALPKAAVPTESFYTSGKMNAEGEIIEYGYLLEAHTAGDIYVYFRNSNVLAVGGVASPLVDPELDWFAGGWLGGRIDSLALLVKLSNDDTRIVPAVGPVITRAQLQAELDLMNKIYDRMVVLVRKGYSSKEMAKEKILDGLDRSLSDPDKFLYDAHKGLWAHHNTLSHDVV